MRELAFLNPEVTIELEDLREEEDPLKEVFTMKAGSGILFGTWMKDEIRLSPK
jgi:hypothetical protein